MDSNKDKNLGLNAVMNKDLSKKPEKRKANINRQSNSSSFNIGKTNNSSSASEQNTSAKASADKSSKKTNKKNNKKAIPAGATIPWDVQLDVRLIGDLEGIKSIFRLGSRSEAVKMLMDLELKNLINKAKTSGKDSDAKIDFESAKRVFVRRTMPKAKKLFRKRRIND